MTADIFYTVAFQLLGFLIWLTLKTVMFFVKSLDFPIVYGDLIENLYQLLNTRTKKGTLLSTNLSVTVLFLRIMTIATLTARVWLLFLAMMPFEKSFTLSHVSILTKRSSDLVKVSIIRPRYDGQIPAIMTASPYHQGTNDKASDKALYKMEGEL